MPPFFAQNALIVARGILALSRPRFARKRQKRRDFLWE